MFTETKTLGIIEDGSKSYNALSPDDQAEGMIHNFSLLGYFGIYSKCPLFFSGKVAQCTHGVARTGVEVIPPLGNISVWDGER